MLNYVSVCVRESSDVYILCFHNALFYVFNNHYVYYGNNTLQEGHIKRCRIKNKKKEFHLKLFQTLSIYGYYVIFLSGNVSNWDKKNAHPFVYSTITYLHIYSGKTRSDINSLV